MSKKRRFKRTPRQAPAGQSPTFDLELTGMAPTGEATGRYQGYINFPLKGYWELHIRVQRGDDKFGVDTEKFMVAEK